MSYLRNIAAVTLSTVALAGSLTAAESALPAPTAVPATPTATTAVAGSPSITPATATTAVAGGPSSRGVIVDRVVASVNQEPVLASDVEDVAHIEALMQGKPVVEIAAADLHAAMERLIDRTLIRQQMSGLPAAVDQPVRSRVAEIRASLPGAESETRWKAILAAYGIDEPKLSKYLQEQFAIMHFVDARLRPSADVSWSEIQSYYNQKLLPELQQRGAAAEPLRSVQERIREILLQQKIDAQLNAWLASLREQGRIRILPPPLEAARDAGSSGGRGTSFSILDRR